MAPKKPQVFVESYSSIESFYDYLCSTPINEPFRWRNHASVESHYSWTQTHSFDEAVKLMRDGWQSMAPTLVQKLKTATQHDAPLMKQRNVLSVAGYQPIVSLYLAGVPTNMISKQLTPVKSKVINVTKLVNYNGATKVDTMIAESVKALQIVKKLETQGYRVNLSVAVGTEADSKQIICKVRIKSANERLNVSKMAFPMVHPSMLRRLFLRFIEVYPEVTKGYTDGYGHPVSFTSMCKAMPGEIVIPSIFTEDVEHITDLDSLKANV